VLEGGLRGRETIMGSLVGGFGPGGGPKMFAGWKEEIDKNRKGKKRREIKSNKCTHSLDPKQKKEQARPTP